MTTYYITQDSMIYGNLNGKEEKRGYVYRDINIFTLLYRKQTFVKQL